MAERAAMVEKQRLAAATRGQGQAAVQNDHHQWAGLDALGGGNTTSNTSTGSKAVVDDHDDWGLGDFGSGAPAPASSAATHRPPQQRAPKSDSSLLDFDSSFNSSQNSKPHVAPAAKSTGSLWDLDEFTSSPAGAYVADATPKVKSKEKFDSPDFDFDFGNREDNPSNGHGQHHEEDDILGMLSKPVEVVRAQAASSQSPSPAPATSTRGNAARSSSPPPHIIGQVVEMGFSPQQARAALAKTESGTDVQAALEILLGDGDQSHSAPQQQQQRNPSRNSPSPPPTRRRFLYDDEEDPEFSAMQRRRGQRQQQPANAEGSSTPNIQEHADKILAQASEIGFSVLSKASLFWKEGKEKVQKVYEERAAGVLQESGDRRTPPTRANGSRDTRPKWMQDAVAHSDDDPASPKRGGFKDAHDDEESSAFREQQAPHPRQRGAPSASSQPSRPTAQPQPEVDLFSSAPAPTPEQGEPKAYVSPWRRKKPTADSSPSPAPVASSSTPSRPPVPSRSRSPPKPKRRLVSCPQMTLDIVREHKTKGTEAFKLGQFSVAQEEYSKAITMLPAHHMLLIPLSTNRALARIRCGECKGAVEDAAEALTLIGRGDAEAWKGWNPSNEDGGWELDNGGAEVNGGYGQTREKGSEWADVWGRGVDLKDGWIKAVRRRAEAFEGMEKWGQARKDWEVLTGAGWVDGKTREDAVRGIGRCKKMVEGSGGGGGNGKSSAGVGSAAPPKVKPRPRPTPARSNVAPSGAAVKAYREQVNAAEAEDTLKHQLKDAVEAKLLAWKKGKEANLRALLASLDIVLWEEVIKDMGGKPGLADLVSGGGVKKWYMKSVARVHPDKLNANNSTVEQRMLAGGVFGALNEAWIAFKQ